MVPSAIQGRFRFELEPINMQCLIILSLAKRLRLNKKTESYQELLSLRRAKKAPRSNITALAKWEFRADTFSRRRSLLRRINSREPAHS